MIGCIRRIRRICQEQRIDFFHLYQLQMGHFPISLAPRLGGPPLVGTFHGRDAKEYPKRPVIGRWLVRQVTQQTTAFTAVSGDLARVAENTIPGVHDVTVIRSGVSPIDRERVSQETGSMLLIVQVNHFFQPVLKLIHSIIPRILQCETNSIIHRSDSTSRNRRIDGVDPIIRRLCYSNYV